jgi:hypothetical protein
MRNFLRSAAAAILIVSFFLPVGAALAAVTVDGSGNIGGGSGASSPSQTGVVNSTITGRPVSTYPGLSSTVSVQDGQDYYGGRTLQSFTVDTSKVDKTQGGMYVDDEGFQGSQGDVGGALAQGSAQCTFGSMLSEMLSSFISYLLESLLSDKATELTTKFLEVPTRDDVTAAQGKAVRAKEVCAWAPFGFCVLPSLDSIAFCFINQVIDYIGKATVEWIKTGFQGSPAFIDDPEKFFTNAIDSVAGNLLNQISDGLLCEPWRAQIQFQLLNEHVSGFNQSAGGCKLSEVSDRWEEFAEGGDFFSWDLQYAYTQNPYNNPLGSYVEAKNNFNIQLDEVRNGLQIQAGWNNGFLNVKDPETGRTTTPGRVIEDQLNRRLGLSEQRLLIADEFDEIINTLVNELIKLALSELLDGGDSESEDGELDASFDFGYGGRADAIGDDYDGNGGNDGGGGGNGGGNGCNDPDGGCDGIGSDLEVSCQFDDDRILENETATVRAIVTGAVGTVTYDWDDDFTGSASSTSKTFADEGNYFALVRVSDQDWDEEEDTATCSVRVSEDFEVVCTVDKTRAETGERVLYTATVTGNDGDVVDYDWGGAASGTGRSISKRYSTRNTYSVHVEAVDEEGNRERVACPDVVVAR